MRLLYLTKSFASKAGVERVLCDKMNWLAEHGYDIMFVTYEQGNHPYAFNLHPSVIHVDLDVRFFELSGFSFGRRFLGYLRYRCKFKEGFQKQIDFFNPDIIITTTYQLKLLDLITNVRTNAKMVLESHIACYKAKKSGEFPRHSIFHYIAMLYDCFFLRRVRGFDELVALTEGDANDWKKYFKNVSIIPNPITFFPNELELKRTEGSNRIIAVGRLDEQKGFDLLIESFSKISNLCNNWKIDIYGDGNDKNMLLDMIKKYDLEGRVIINPPTSDIYKEYMSSDFFVLSSRYEGYALVLNEAMSCSLPCVAFRCKYGPEDAIINGENGLLVPNGDMNLLADGMLWLIEHEEERLKMGQKARISSARYKKEKIMEEWNKLFDSLMH